MPGRVLLIDDEWDNLECVQEFLQDDFEVVAACGGDAGLECLEEEAFDVVVLDITMPRVDGLDVMAFVRKHRPRLPVLVASGLYEVERLASQMGASGWMRKPLRFDELKQRLNGLIAGAQRPQQRVATEG